MGRPEIREFEKAPADTVEPVAAPQVFVRTFQTPAAMPWDQARAANLEARHGAPLPLADLMHRLRRMEPWAPGQSARYAVFYIRRRDYTGPFETLVDVDGQSTRVAFGKTGRAAAAKQGRSAGFVVTLGVVAALGLASTGGWMAFQARAENEAELSRLEQQAAAKLRLARKAQHQRDVVRDLALVRNGAARPEEVLAEIAWVGRARTPDARLVGFHWDHGLLALEARGEAAPVTLTGGRLERSPKPLRPGVWLWGVSRDAGAAP